MPTPELKRYGELRAADLERHPVWVACHVADHDEPWYDMTDEETFRPATDAVPIDADPGAYLIKAVFAVADGATYPGFVTSGSGEDMGMVQPIVLVGQHQIAFWGGMIGIAADERARVYAAFGKSARQVFPIAFRVPPGITGEPIAGRIDGFYRIDDDDRIVVEH